MVRFLKRIARCLGWKSRRRREWERLEAARANYRRILFGKDEQ